MTSKRDVMGQKDPDLDHASSLRGCCPLDARHLEPE